MSPGLKSFLKYLFIFIFVLALVNLSIRVYEDVTTDCPVDEDVTLSHNYHEETLHNNNNIIHSETLCCPKVFIYDPRKILLRAQRLHDKPLLLQHLDPLNFPETFDRIPYDGSQSIPEHDRVKVLTQLLRWMPQEDEVNQSLIVPFGDSETKIWYSKDFLNMFSMRIALSKCVTTDPHEAELFLIPMSVHTDHNHGRKTPLSGEWDALFSKLSNYQLLFEHFSINTAAKHIIFSSSFGHSRRSIGLWHPPFQDPRVAVMQRVALGSDCLITQSYKLLHHFIKSPRRVHSTPFASLLSYPEDYFDRNEISYRNETSSPSDNDGKHNQGKVLLASAFFGFHGGEKVRKLRKKID